MLHFLASVGPCNLILLIHVVGQLTAVKKVSADQYYLTVPRAHLSTHRGLVFFLFTSDLFPVFNAN